MSRTPTTLMSFALLVPFAEPQGYVFTRIATALEPGALSPGMSKPELLEALRKKALGAASLVPALRAPIDVAMPCHPEESTP